jgi:zinc transport system substrate-binding protein
MARLRFLSLLLFGPLALGSCGDAPAGDGGAGAGASDGKPVVLTSFYPTTYFATRIAGDRAEVRLPLPAGADPIYWKPSADAVAAYQAADLIVVNGAGFEKWIEQVSLPASRVVDTAAGFEEQWVRYEEETTHSHGPEGEHTHTGLDGHTWLDPQLAILQSRAIADALVALRPDDATVFEANFAALEQDLLELDAGFQALGKVPAGEPLYASPPAYNYLKKRYGWEVVNLDLDLEQVPDPLTLLELKQQLKEERGRFLLWEGEPTPEVVAAMQGLALQSLVISPCEGAPEAGGPDYLASMRANLKQLQLAFAAGE